MNYIDFHCDSLMAFCEASKEDLLYSNDHMLDLVRLKQAGCSAQFFATFMPNPDWMHGLNDEQYRQNLYAGLMSTIARHPDYLAFAKNYEDYVSNQQKGITSAFLTFEDGRMIDSDMENLQRFYSLGYRLITLTWNYPNCFGWPNSTDPEIMGRGLTSFGKDAIQQMNQLGIIIDVSHLNDGGFRDVAEISKKPFVASHSCSRALTPHPRNLTDDMIRTIAEKGGLVGVNFAPEFTGRSIHDTDSTVENICRHIVHIADIGGIDVVGIGSDFDGISGNLEVGSPTDIPKLFSELSRRGFTPGDIEKFAFRNAERILHDVL